MAISFPRYKISWSGTPGLTPRCLRIAPLNADGATGSVAVQNVQAGSSFVEQASEFLLFLPFLAPRHDRIYAPSLVGTVGLLRLAEDPGLLGFR